MAHERSEASLDLFYQWRGAREEQAGAARGDGHKANDWQSAFNWAGIFGYSAEHLSVQI
jgi:hypothetical protein